MAQAYTLRARLHTSHENLDAALADLGEALKINANDVGTILFRAELHLFRDDTKSAREDIEEALRQRPGLVLGILMRSRVNAAEKKFEDAIQDMELLVQNDPLNADYRLQLAAYYSADDRPRKAIKLLGELIDNDKNNWRALRSRGDARLAIGEHAEAVEDYNQALAINPDDSGVLNNLAWVLATSPIDEVRDADRSLELATKACELTEYKQAHILSTLASSYAEKGDFESAIKWSSKAVELGEGDVKEQLEKELESYRAAKPWREKQETKEKPDLPKRNLLET
jgi:tetratricopeptide (TPR) repeat protein